MTQITVEVSFPVILDILSISTSLMLGLLFMFSKTNNRKANVFLGLFLLSLSIEVFEVFLQSVDNIELKVIQTSLFTIPFLFIYVNQTLNMKMTWMFILLFIPGFLLNIYVINFSFFNYFEYVFNICLLVFILKILKSHQQKVGDYYSDIEHKTLSWLKAIVFIFLSFHAFWIFEDFVGIQNEDWAQWFPLISTIFTFFMIFWIGHNGFSQSEIFTLRLFQLGKKELNVTEITSKGIQKFESISEMILQEKYFTNPNLNLRTLSIHLNLKEKELSKLINLHTEKNFYHYINQFRVNEFKESLRLPKAKQLTLLGLAEEAGFSSKSTFYTAFKNLEGLTPKQFQNQLKKSE